MTTHFITPWLVTACRQRLETPVRTSISWVEVDCPECLNAGYPAGPRPEELS